MRKINEDSTFDYQLLDRCKGDCEYCLGAAKSITGLWGKTIERHIAKMRELYNKLSEKPEWISMEDIDYFEKELYKLEKRSESTFVVDSDIRISESLILKKGDKVQLLKEEDIPNDVELFFTYYETEDDMENDRSCSGPLDSLTFEDDETVAAVIYLLVQNFKIKQKDISVLGSTTQGRKVSTKSTLEDVSELDLIFSTPKYAEVSCSLI